MLQLGLSVLRKMARQPNAFYGILALLWLGAYPLDAQTPRVNAGRIHRIDNFPSQHVEPRHVDVWLPEDYSPSQSYAVLYMHDGQMLFDPDQTWNRQAWQVDETTHALLSVNALQPFIVVGIWNHSLYRRSEYAPQKAIETLPTDILQAMLQHHLQGATRADAYLRFLVEELKPYIDAHFTTLPDAEHTALMGSSMGGLISLYALCEYPNVFGQAACLSTHWPGTMDGQPEAVPDAIIAYFSEKIPQAGTHRIYFDYGTATLDSLYEPHQMRINRVMERKGYTQAQWVALRFEGAEHSEVAWAQRLHLPLLFLFGACKK